MFHLTKLDNRESSTTFGYYLHLFTESEEIFQKSVDSEVDDVTIVARGYGQQLPDNPSKVIRVLSPDGSRVILVVTKNNMIIKDKKRSVQKSSDFKSNKFTIAATAESFRILSKDLYTNQIQAVVRELSTNAQDSHTESGNDNPLMYIFLRSLNHS